MEPGGSCVGCGDDAVGGGEVRGGRHGADLAGAGADRAGPGRRPHRSGRAAAARGVPAAACARPGARVTEGCQIEQLAHTTISPPVRRHSHVNRVVPGRDAARDTPRMRHAEPPAPVPSFVGRCRELAELSALVDGHRLVTLVGPGGAGQTRLAVQWLSTCRSTSRIAGEPAGFIDLGPVSDPALVPATVSRGCGLGDERGGGAVGAPPSRGWIPCSGCATHWPNPRRSSWTPASTCVMWSPSWPSPPGPCGEDVSWLSGWWRSARSPRRSASAPTLPIGRRGGAAIAGPRHAEGRVALRRAVKPPTGDRYENDDSAGHANHAGDPIATSSTTPWPTSSPSTTGGVRKLPNTASSGQVRRPPPRARPARSAMSRSGRAGPRGGGPPLPAARREP